MTHTATLVCLVFIVLSQGSNSTGGVISAHRLVTLCLDQINTVYVTLIKQQKIYKILANIFSPPSLSHSLTLNFISIISMGLFLLYSSIQHSKYRIAGVCLYPCKKTCNKRTLTHTFDICYSQVNMLIWLKRQVTFYANL